MFDPNDPLFWVLVAFVAFLALLLYYKVPAIVAKALDDRADAIRKELDEARKLREEAQSLLSDYQRKAREAETEAQSIIEQAKLGDRMGFHSFWTVEEVMHSIELLGKHVIPEFAD